MPSSRFPLAPSPSRSSHDPAHFELFEKQPLPQCTAHGLKKAGATIAAENGATTRQLMAMFDWDTPEMAEVYTRAAEQKKLAGEGMFLISLDRSANENCRTEPRVGEK
jgi:hypothetical protein